MFLMMAYCDCALSKCVVACMSFALSFTADLDPAMRQLFRASAAYCVESVFRFEGVLLMCILVQIGNQYTLDMVDAFAHAGHMTLFASTVALDQSVTFVSACVCNLAFWLVRMSAWDSAAYIAVAAYVYMGRRPSTSWQGEAEYWHSRTLWDCSPLATLSVAVYSGLLLVKHWSCDTQDDPPLFALHIGGIFATCVFVFPQVAPTAHQIFQAILCSAALVDAIVAVICAKTIELSVVDVAHIVAALVVAVAIALTQAKTHVMQPTDDPQVFGTSRSKSLRALLASAYVALSFIKYIKDIDIILSYAHITHFCFIVGGLAMSAIVWDDILFMYLTGTLVVFEMVGICVEANLEIDPQDVVRATLILLSLPYWSARGKVGVLSFYTKE